MTNQAVEEIRTIWTETTRKCRIICSNTLNRIFCIRLSNGPHSGLSTHAFSKSMLVPQFSDLGHEREFGFSPILCITSNFNLLSRLSDQNPGQSGYARSPLIFVFEKIGRCIYKLKIWVNSGLLTHSSALGTWKSFYYRQSAITLSLSLTITLSHCNSQGSCSNNSKKCEAHCLFFLTSGT